MNNRFVLAGGSYWSEGRKLRTAAVDIYDPLTNRLYAQGGLAIPVSDEDVWAAQRTLLHLEGIYTEPAGATALAGACRAAGDGRIGRSSEVVCLVTGSGFKDADSLAGAAARSPEFLLDPPALHKQVLEITRAGLGA